MPEYNDLRLTPNMPPVGVQFLFDEPRSFPSKRNKDELRYAYRLRLLEPFGDYPAGKEVTLWTSIDSHVKKLSAFRRGDRVTLQAPQNAGERTWSLVVREMGLDEGPVYDAPSGTNGSSGNGAKHEDAASATGMPHDVIRMGESLAQAYESVVHAAELLRGRYGDEVADAFAEGMSTPDILQKTGVSIFIEKRGR